MQTDETAILGVQERPFHGIANGIGSIQNHYGNLRLLTCLHAQVQRPDEGVITRPHILHVHEQCIQTLQHFRRGFTMFAIQAVNRNSPIGMRETTPFNHIVLSLAQIAVLRPKKGFEAE